MVTLTSSFLWQTEFIGYNGATIVISRRVLLSMFRILPYCIVLFCTSFVCSAMESTTSTFTQVSQFALFKLSDADQLLDVEIFVNNQSIEKKQLDNRDHQYFSLIRLPQTNIAQSSIRVIVNYSKETPKIEVIPLDKEDYSAHKNALAVLTDSSPSHDQQPYEIISRFTTPNLQTDFSDWALRHLLVDANKAQKGYLSFLINFNLNKFRAEDILEQCNAWTRYSDPVEQLETAVDVKFAAQLAATLYVYSKHHGKLVDDHSSLFNSAKFMSGCGRIFSDMPPNQQADIDLDIYAKNLYQRVLETLSKTPNWLTADILHHLWFYYNFEDKHSLALETVKSAIAKAEKAPQYQFLMTELYSNAFLSSYRQGAFAQAHNYLNKGLNIGTPSSQSNIAPLLYSKGFLLFQTGEFDTGESYFFDTIKQVQKTSSSQKWELASCLKLGPQNLMIARAAVMIGATSREQGNFKGANQWLQCAEHLLKDQHDYYQIVLQVELAKTAIKQKEFNKAKAHLDKVFNDPRTLDTTKIDAKILQLKVDNVHLAKPSNREELDELAALLGYDSFYDENVSNINDATLPIKQIEVFTLLVQISQQEKSFKWIDIFADKAMSLIEKSRSNVANPQAWNAARFSFINTYISSLLDSKRFKYESNTHYSKLFEVLEKFYSVDPKQEKNLFSIDEAAKDNAEQIQLFYNVWLAEEKRMLLTDSADEKLRFYEARDDYFAQVLNQQNNSIEVSHISLDSFQELLPPEQMLVRYFSDGQCMYSLSVTRNSISVQKVAEMTLLAKMVESYVDGTSASSRPWLNAEYQDISLLPIDIIEQQHIDKILIIPDESLHKMPFSMWNTNSKGSRYKPLVETSQSVFITSATSYFEQLHASESETFEISIFANPDFSGPESEAIGTLPERLSLASLPGTLKEAEFVANLFSAHQINKGFAENATSQFLMSNKVRNSKILHIGTHGYFDKKSPDIVGVLTAGETVAGNITPGFLSLSQLLSKPVSSDLVFVSGCETMVGKNYKGSGMRSITRGFLAQGAKTVVGTIWAIQDRPTSEFVKQFYANLLELGGDAPKALQVTQYRFHSSGKYRHPKYWAGFVLTSSNQGDSQIFSSALAKNSTHD
ncbi:CHAT domain-containing protein [Aliiglaciecola sp. 3_MG-2023]|uniref:CHAT domain-containing protein n=1 Tax=Aliiglaciecola sp. 3_MG-2023 TaxID=3062644 RepID=UPI0026E462EC|nr:CHAT domain-containing protein [Aliiglaciecola sp. 3_MG-2023]MDO6692347.1 CHAT domain-containing protein [Aliiglaciecola sp. 3_MG-2023]